MADCLKTDTPGGGADGVKDSFLEGDKGETGDKGDMEGFLMLVGISGTGILLWPPKNVLAR